MLLLRRAVPQRRPRAEAEAREALQRAAALAQEGRLQEADQQAQPALSDPETRAAACSVLGAIRLQQNRLEEGADLLQEADPAGTAPPRGPPEPGAGLHAARERRERRCPALPPRPGAGPVERGGTDGPRPRGDREGKLPAVAGAGQAGSGRIQAVSRRIAGPGHRLPEDRRSVLRRRAGRGLEAADDVPPAWSVSFAELLVKGGLVAEGIDVLERAREADPSSYELAFALGGAYLVKGDPARALEAYDAALALKPGSAHGAAAGGRGRRAAGRAGAIPLLLDAREEARGGRSADPPGVRPRLPQDGPPGRRRARAVEAAGLKPGEPAYQYTLAVAKVGKRQYEAAQAPARAARREAARTTRSSSTRWGPCSTCRGTWRKPRRSSGRASGWTPTSWRRPTTSRWSPGTRATTPRPSTSWRRCCGAIRITPRRARRWAGCS